MNGYGLLVASKNKIARLIFVTSLAWLEGCVSPSALDHAVIAYDESTSEILSELLLINISRGYRILQLLLIFHHKV